MKILAFTDVHGDLSYFERIKKDAKKHNVDVIVCAGDYTFFEQHIEYFTKKLSELGKEVILVHGNHEYGDAVASLCKKYKNLHFIDNKVKKIGDYLFIGHGGGGFSLNDPDFVESMKKLMKVVDKKQKIVLVTHAPPNATKLDKLPSYGHVGNKDYRKFIEENNVVLAVSGHLHENFEKEDKIGKALVINPGYKGRIITLG